MNILQSIASLDENTGGPARSVNHLSAALTSLGLKNTIISEQTNSPVLFKNSNLNYLFSSKNSFRTLFKETLKTKTYKIVHSHGIWLPINHYTAKLSRLLSIPYIISPRGMLEPWSMQQGKLKKKIALKLFQKKDLEKATCIHATAKSEAENIRSMGFKNPIAIIPNGIDLQEFPNTIKKPNTNTKTLLFLSRIHPKKGIELLIEAWLKLPIKAKQHWNIEIAGNGEDDYIDILQKKINTAQLQKEIRIIGPQFGNDKLRAYQRADLFVLPTYSENFGIVVAEALACGVPVITTNGTPWQELNETRSGWCIDLSIEKLTNTLEYALCLKQEELALMGQNGRKLVEDNYSIGSVAKKMKELYEWILNPTSPKPDFVYLD